MMQITYITELTGRGEIHELVLTGHAEYDDTGKDIVCSAASALLITLAEMLGRRSDVEEDIQAGNATIRCQRAMQDEYTKTCFEFAVAGLEMLSDSYPDNIIVN